MDYNFSPAARWALTLASRQAQSVVRESYTNSDLMAAIVSVLLGLNDQKAAAEFNEDDWKDICREGDIFYQAWRSIPNIIIGRAVSMRHEKPTETTSNWLEQKDNKIIYLAGIMGINPQRIRQLPPGIELVPDEETITLLALANGLSQGKPCITLFELFIAVLEQGEPTLESWLNQLGLAGDSVAGLLLNARDGLLMVRNSTFLVLPFAYQMNYHEAAKHLQSQSVSTKKGKIINVWNPIEFQTERLFHYIEVLISSEHYNPGTIGCRYRMAGEQGRDKYKLPPRPNQPIYLHRKEGTVQFYLDDVELLLFKTQVGFLVYQIHYDSAQGIDNIILGNYGLKKFSLDDQRLGYIITKSDPDAKDNGIYHKESKWEGLNLVETSLNILNELNVLTFFEQEIRRAPTKKLESDSIEAPPAAQPAHALVYTAVVMDKSINQYPEWQDVIMKILFRLRRSFKESYKPAPFEYSIDGNPEVLQFFENSYWGISSEAVANLVYLVDDETTNAFFSGNYFGNLKQSYYYLYILTLHQRYALLNLAIEAAKLPLDVHALASEERKERQEKLLETRDKMAFFVLRCVFRQVSNISHQNRLYESIRTALGIQSLMEEIDWELKAINSLDLEMVDMDRQKTAEYRQEERKRWEQERHEWEKARDDDRRRWEKDKEDREKVHREEQMKIELEKKERDEQHYREQEAEQKLQRFIVVISTVFLIITTIEAAWQIYSLIRSGVYPPPESACFVVCLIFITSVIGLTLMGVIYYFSEWRQVKNRSKPVEEGKKQSVSNTDASA